MSNTMIQQQGGHGDMYMRRVAPEAIPADVREKLEHSHLAQAILAEGEKTGHAHRLTSDAPIGMVRVSDMVAYVLLRDAGLLTHEEHGAREITEPGYYEVPTERDYDPTLYAERVVD